ncbi:MAG: Zn-dependent hydrolase, partial [Marinomonas sp.]
MTQSPMKVNGSRLWQSLMDLAKIGATPLGGNCRLALTDEDKAGRDLVIRWFRDEGMSIRIDQIGNIFARREGRQADLAPVMCGSHIDTQ